ncbi:CPBP family glutamic-type intramembrane protease [Halovulum sp. GXIMD14793]
MFLMQSSPGKNQWWRYALTLLITILAFVAGHIPLIALVTVYARKGGFSEAELDQLLAAGGLGQIGVGSNMALVVMLVPFAVALIALVTCLRVIHARGLLSVLTSRHCFDFRRVATAGLAWFVIAGGLVLLAVPSELLSYQYKTSAFLPLLAITVLLLPLQVAAEEVLFRGYLLQAFARMFATPIWPLLMTTGLFAIVHLSNPEFRNGFASVVPVYLLLSLFFGLLTVLDDGLELAIGAHLANNLFTALVLSTSDGAMNTASIFQTQVAVIVSHLWVLLLAIPLVLGLLHLRYRFDCMGLFRRR